MPAKRVWTEEAIVEAVQRFFVTHQRWPTAHDFTPTQHLPHLTVVRQRMRTWQEAVRQATAKETRCSTP